MILRLGGLAAIHAAGGVAMGVTTVLAACTVARVAKVALAETRRPGSRLPRAMGPMSTPMPPESRARPDPERTGPA